MIHFNYKVFKMNHITLIQYNKYDLINQQSFQNLINYKTKKDYLNLEDLKSIRKKLKEKDKFLLFLYSELKFNSNPDVFEALIKQLDNHDIILLNNHSDNCLKIEEAEKQDLYSLYKTRSAKGFHSILLKKETLDLVIKKMIGKEHFDLKLESLIYQGNLNAVFSWPQLYIFPPEKYRKYGHLYNFCRNEKVRVYHNANRYSFFWFLITIIIVIFSLRFVLRRLPKNKYYMIKKRRKLF